MLAVGFWSNPGAPVTSPFSFSFVVIFLLYGLNKRKQAHVLQEDPFKGNVLSKSVFHRMGKLLFGSEEMVCFGLRLGKRMSNRSFIISVRNNSVLFVVVFYFFITI